MFALSLLLAAFLIVTDQVLKAVVNSKIELGKVVEVIKLFLHLNDFLFLIQYKIFLGLIIIFLYIPCF